MVLINIDTLSDSELRYIAQQEELEDWKDLSREELIEELESLYEKDDVQQNLSGSSERKFVRTLTVLESENVLGLPGTEELPQHYNETEIHVIQKDSSWAYAFWNISNHRKKELESARAGLLLRTKVSDCEGTVKAVYDIDVSLQDSNWTIELPYAGFRYQTSLVAVTASGQEVVCQSAPIETNACWLSENPEMLRDDVTFRTIFPSLITNGGEVFGNRRILGLIDLMNSQDPAVKEARK